MKNYQFVPLPEEDQKSINFLKGHRKEAVENYRNATCNPLIWSVLNVETNMSLKSLKVPQWFNYKLLHYDFFKRRQNCYSKRKRDFRKFLPGMKSEA